jgi:hypothetical protein
MKHVQRELATGPQMRMRAAQRRQLIVPCEVVKKSPKRNHDERECFVQRERAHVALTDDDSRLHVQRQRRGFLTELVEHASVAIESGDADAAFRNRDADAACTRTQLEHRSPGVESLAAIPLDVTLEATGVHHVVHVRVVARNGATVAQRPTP